MKKNPVPKIGRKGKSGYQEKEFVPSRKLLKQMGLTLDQFRQRRAKKAAQTVKRYVEGKAAKRLYKLPHYKEQIYEAARTYAPEAVFGKSKSYFEKFTESLEKLGKQVAAGEYVGEFLGVGDLPEGTLIDKLAVLANLNTIDTASEILDTDVDLLLKAIEGYRLNRLEQERLRGSYSELYQDPNLQNQYNIDIDYVEREAAILTDSIKEVDLELAQIFRNVVSNGEIDLDTFDKGYHLLGGTLPRNQLARILESYQELAEKGFYTTYIDGKEVHRTNKIDLNEMFEMYEADGFDIWNIEDSEFWEWFRELFY